METQLSTSTLSEPSSTSFFPAFDFGGPISPYGSVLSDFDGLFLRARSVRSLPVTLDEDHLLSEFCFLSRWYYGACRDEDECKARIFLPGEKPRLFDICSCPSLRACVPDPAPTLPPRPPIDASASYSVVIWFCFVPLVVVLLAIICLGVVACFVSQHKRQWHEKFILEPQRMKRRS